MRFDSWARWTIAAFVLACLLMAAIMTCCHAIPTAPELSPAPARDSLDYFDPWTGADSLEVAP